MTLKEKIINTLKDTEVENIDKMLKYLEKHEYYECKSSSHNHWIGGTAQHVWAVYLIAKALRDRRMNEPNITKYATDKKLAIVCLLHDICDMSVSVYDNNHKWVSGHGGKSYWIMNNLKVGTEVERMVVCNHMHKDATYHFNNQQETDEYNALHSLITEADHSASGTAWNSTRFKGNRTQHYGVLTEDISYLRAVAMDRTVQSGKYHLYMDEKLELREYKNYNRKQIQWNSHEDVVNQLNRIEKVQLNKFIDVISAAHQYMAKTKERLCIVVGICSKIPEDKDKRLRRYYIDEQDILICTNLLNSFYKSETTKKSTKKFRFEFTMRDEVKECYRNLSSQEGGIYLKDVVMIRDGFGRGFPFVEPWKVDILLVSGKQFPMFAIQASILTNSI